MFENFFKGLFDTSATAVISVGDFLLCVFASLVIGILIAACYMYRSRYTKSFVMTLAMLPAVVCVVILMVNGNLGAGVAVAGAFSLVRFRSVPGTAREIGMLFLAMGAGLIAGMGYLGFSFLFAVVLGLVSVIYSRLDLGSSRNSARFKSVKITIPEDLDYSGAFDDLFKKYTIRYELVQVKSTNLGSMFRLTYDVTLKDPKKEKEFIDQLRCRNGNLEISVSVQDTGVAEL